MVQHQKGMYMEYVDDDEVLLGTIYKHLFGLILIYAQAIIAIILSFGLAIVLLPLVISTVKALSLILLFGTVVSLFAFVILLVATIIYRQSRIVITDKNITQVLQGGLFSRKVSQLTMANVEDVTAVQHGIFATMLDYGELRVETAGEQENFVFTFCPRPGYYAKIILEAREKFISREYPYAAAYKGQTPMMQPMMMQQPPAQQAQQSSEGQPNKSQQPAGALPEQAPEQS